MRKPITLSSTLALGLICSAAAFGQTQGPALYARDICVKVRDGKWQEYSAFLQSVTAKLAAVRVESGAYASYAIAEAVAPTGRSARCDYHLVTTYAGFPQRHPALSRLPRT